MSKKKLVMIFLTLFIISVNVLIIAKAKLGMTGNSILYIGIDLEADQDTSFQVFYDDHGNYSEQRSFTIGYSKKDGRRKLNFEIRPDSTSIRLDMGSVAASVNIYDVYLRCAGTEEKIPLHVLADSKDTKDIEDLYIENDVLLVKTLDGDSNIIFSYDGQELLGNIYKDLKNKSIGINIAICVVIDLLFLFFMLKFNSITEIPKDIIKEHKLILTLAKNDFKTRFAGSYLGIVWAFIQPIVTIFVYWFVFEKGLRAGRMVDYPFVLWLMCGLVPWFYFSDALNGGTNALIEYSYLVKKVVFKISILPFVKVLSNIFIHVFFIVFVVCLHFCYGYKPNLYWIQIFYYMFCTFVLVLGLSYLTSALVVFFRDLTQIISIILQIGMWATPILWNAGQYSQKLDFVLKINPVYYIVQGYRNTLLAGEWFWNDIYWTLYFWIAVVMIFFLGQGIFKKLRVHFADVL